MSAQPDILVIGSGLAGLAAALRLAETRRVVLVTKNELLAGASAWAQGGIIPRTAATSSSAMRGVNLFRENCRQD